jgi:haloalkane dehalogenase
MISAAFPYEKRHKTVLGQSMAYVDVGKGDPIVFLHGNPESSYVWRNVIPYVERFGRCIAPDLIGMGDSAKLPASGPGAYTFAQHREYLDALLDTLGVRERITLVVHDWGSALGFDWANRHRDAVHSIAYMEAIIQPRTWEDYAPDARRLFQALRSEAGEAMILGQNFFVEVMLPRSILRTLTDEEMAEYRRPFAEPGEGRRPTLSWPRQLPINGEPPEMVQLVKSYADWLATSTMPKLFVKGEPGAILTSGPAVDFCRTWPNQTEVPVKGVHFLQEDSPDAIGQALASWLTRVRGTVNVR